MAYLYRSSGPGGGSIRSISASTWVRFPASTWGSSQCLFNWSGGDGSGGQFNVAGFSTVMAVSGGASTTEVYPVVLESGTYNFAAIASWNSVGGGITTTSDRWHLIQMSMTVASGSMFYDSFYHGMGKASACINLVPFTVAGIAYLTSGSVPNPPLNVPFTDQQPWPIRFDGPNGFPDFNSARLDLNQKALEFADVYIWVGSYLDFTNSAVASSFVSISGGIATPASPNNIRSAFGTPTYEFRGKASDSTFFFNRGNGGSFSKIGTISDFTPGPSYT